MRTLALFSLSSLLIWAAPPQSDYLSAKHKLASIQQRRLLPGSSVNFTAREIDAWASVEIPKEIPHGFREPHVQLGESAATGTAMVNFLKMRQANGQTTNWFMSKLLEGERPLKVSVRLHSSGGHCTVDLTRVEISDVVAEGSVLDFLLRTFFLSVYPQAKIGQPFQLGYNIERLEIHLSGVVARIGPPSHR